MRQPATPPPGRPRIVEAGVEVRLEIEGKVRCVVVTRAAFDCYLGAPPAHVEKASVERGWLGVVQHNMDRVRAGAERKLAVTSPTAELIMLGPGDLDFEKRA